MVIMNNLNIVFLFVVFCVSVSNGFISFLYGLDEKSCLVNNPPFNHGYSTPDDFFGHLAQKKSITRESGEARLVENRHVDAQ